MYAHGGMDRSDPTLVELINVGIINLLVCSPLIVLYFHKMKCKVSNVTDKIKIDILNENLKVTLSQ